MKIHHLTVSLALFFSILGGFCPVTTFAGSAEWLAAPGSGNWTTDANWSPAAYPNGPADTATFSMTNTPGVFLGLDTEVEGIVFTAAAANPYTITVDASATFTVGNGGITNN